MQKINKGQSTVEYAVLIAVVVGALIAMQIYMKRGFQGKLRESTDQVGEQFEASNTTMTSVRNRTAKTVQTVASGETTVRTGSEGKGQEVVQTYVNETVGSW